jgi:hypothetical protein
MVSALNCTGVEDDGPVPAFLPELGPDELGAKPEIRLAKGVTLDLHEEELSGGW